MTKTEEIKKKVFKSISFNGQVIKVNKVGTTIKLPNIVNGKFKGRVIVK